MHGRLSRLHRHLATATAAAVATASALPTAAARADSQPPTQPLSLLAASQDLQRRLERLDDTLKARARDEGRARGACHHADAGEPRPCASLEFQRSAAGKACPARARI